MSTLYQAWAFRHYLLYFSQQSLVRHILLSTLLTEEKIKAKEDIGKYLCKVQKFALARL